MSAQTPAVPGSVPGDAAATAETGQGRVPERKTKRKGAALLGHGHQCYCEHRDGYCHHGWRENHQALEAAGRQRRRRWSLPKLKGCTVSVAATFEAGSKGDAETFDVCKDKSIRFTD